MKITSVNVLKINKESSRMKGIASVLIGLAFQDLFKDVIVGFFIIIEDQFSVGDTIEVSGFKGEVIHIGMKTWFYF